MTAWKLTLDTSAGRDGKPERVEVVLRAGERCSIGRRNTNRVVCHVGNIAAHHADLMVEGDTVLLEVTLSSSGTFHQGKPVQRARLAVGDRFVAGAVLLTLVALQREVSPFDR